MAGARAGNRADMPQESAGAVVIGAGPNGLVAACTLADAGWDVVVLEAADRVGGAVKSERRVPGYVHDMYSAFYPLAAASPVLAKLGLDDHGLRWRHAPAVVAHLLSPEAERAAVLHRDPASPAPPPPPPPCSRPTIPVTATPGCASSSTGSASATLSSTPSSRRSRRSRPGRPCSTRPVPTYCR